MMLVVTYRHYYYSYYHLHFSQPRIRNLPLDQPHYRRMHKRFLHALIADFHLGRHRNYPIHLPDITITPTFHAAQFRILPLIRIGRHGGQICPRAIFTRESRTQWDMLRPPRWELMQTRQA